MGILEIRGNNFRLRPIALETVRAFAMDEIVLSSVDDGSIRDPNDVDGIYQTLANKVEEMLAKLDEEWQQKLNSSSSVAAGSTDNNNNNINNNKNKNKNNNNNKNNKSMPQPLIRLKVEYSGGFATVNPQRFGQRFVGRLANPTEILLFYKKRASSLTRQEGSGKKKNLKDLMAAALRPEPADQIRIEDLIESYLESSANLEILPEHDFHVALHQFVEKDEKSAITQLIEKSTKTSHSLLRKEDPVKLLEPQFIQTTVANFTAQMRKTHSNNNNNKPLVGEEEQENEEHDEAAAEEDSTSLNNKNNKHSDAQLVADQKKYQAVWQEDDEEDDENNNNNNNNNNNESTSDKETKKGNKAKTSKKSSGPRGKKTSASPAPKKINNKNKNKSSATLSFINKNPVPINISDNEEEEEAVKITNKKGFKGIPASISSPPSSPERLQIDTKRKG